MSRRHPKPVIRCVSTKEVITGPRVRELLLTSIGDDCARIGRRTAVIKGRLWKQVTFGKTVPYLMEIYRG